MTILTVVCENCNEMALDNNTMMAKQDANGKDIMLCKCGCNCFMLLPLEAELVPSGAMIVDTTEDDEGAFGDDALPN